MHRIPVWAFALSFLIWLVITLAFGNSVKRALESHNKEHISVHIASPVQTIKNLINDLRVALVDKNQFHTIDIEERFDYSGFENIAARPGIDIDGLMIKYDREKIAKGWRLMAGLFKINGELEHAALILSPDMEITRVFMPDEIAPSRSKSRKFLHGMDIVEDGSVIFTFDGGNSVQRFDRCGKRLWSVAGEFHHALTIDEAHDTFWAFRGSQSITQIRIEDGEILRTISMEEVIEANPLTDILQIRRIIDNDIRRNKRKQKSTWMREPFHFNDVQPLPSSLADKFPGFEPGDLLLSARSLNLVLVLDPDTLEVKWWRAGATEHQHDPDWLPNGWISILNNRTTRDYSEIIAINPETYERRTLYDGRKGDFYTRIRGRHQILDSGNIIVTSTQQGRVFEVGPDGEIVLEILNVKSAGNDRDNPKHYTITDMVWRTPDNIDFTRPCP